MRLEPLNLYELEDHAAKFISPHAWAFIEGGAQDEVTVKRNRSALGVGDAAAPGSSRILPTATFPPPCWGRKSAFR